MSREMKHSGIEWIGEIPKRWKVIRGKYLFEVLNGFAFNSSLFTKESHYTPLIRIRDISNANTEAYYMGDYSLEYIVKKGEVLVGMDGDFNVAKWKGIDALLNQRVCKLSGFSENCLPQYVFYILPLLLKGKNDVTYATTVKHLSSNDILNFSYLVPSLSEQQKIADYLDKVSGEVDEMIALQEQMIEELKAYKQSIITEAVTKGLNPNVPMKNSGIDWIGEIPGHWEIQRLRTLGWTQNGISQSGDYFGEDYAYPFVSYSDAYKNYSVPYPEGKANSSEEDRNKYSLVEGDVLFTRTSETIEEIGFSSTCLETINDAVYSGFLIRFRPTSNKLYKGFSKYYFRSQIHRAYFVKQMNIVTRASLGQDLLKNLVVLLPTLSEQQQIASYLDEKCSEIDSLIATKQQKIEELKEYKKSIIYEYVTGKKEVV